MRCWRQPFPFPSPSWPCRAMPLGHFPLSTFVPLPRYATWLLCLQSNVVVHPLSYENVTRQLFSVFLKGCVFGRRLSDFSVCGCLSVSLLYAAFLMPVPALFSSDLTTLLFLFLTSVVLSTTVLSVGICLFRHIQSTSYIRSRLPITVLPHTQNRVVIGL